MVLQRSGGRESDNTSFLKLIDSLSDFLLLRVYLDNTRAPETGPGEKAGGINGGDGSMAF